MFKNNLLSDKAPNLKDRILRWGAFALFFAYFWHTYQIFTDIPAYRDALEVVWGILWYNHALTEWVNPFHYPLIFHPEGWQVGILAHTPLIFMVSQPFYILGGEVFAYNMLAIIPFFISYSGALRFFKHYTKSPLTLIAVSLAFTFVAMRTSRVGGHLHILWATSFLPWLGYHLNHWREQDEKSIWNTNVVMSGIYFGLMVGFSLYSIFLAPIAFFLLERKLFQWRKIPQLILTGTIALLIGSTALLPYLWATRNESIESPGIQSLTFWGASINNLFVPSIFHSLDFVRNFSNSLQGGGGGEARSLNMGLMTLFLAVIGLYYVWRQPKNRLGHVFVFIVGCLFSLGPLLKYNAEPLQVDSLGWLNEVLWGWGRAIKPDVFKSDLAPTQYLKGIPLPSYLFIIFVPFWEGARTVARFAMVAFLGALGLAAEGLDRLPRWLGLFLMIIWLIEMLPIQTGSERLVFDTLHPAHEWLIAQPMEPGKGILDLDPKIMHGATPLYISWQTKIPTASAIGSFLPAQSKALLDNASIWNGRSLDSLARLYQAYDIRYLVIHNNKEKSNEVWEYLQTAPDHFTAVGCFDPPADYESPWAYPICIIEIKDHPTVSNIHPIYGFSDEESWGMWSIEDRPRFNFIATAEKPYQVEAEIFPHCIDGQLQSLSMIYHDQTLYTHEWEDCEPIHIQLTIPAEEPQVGLNEIQLELGYALSPAELGTGNDPRKLGVGFSKFQIRPVE